MKTEKGKFQRQCPYCPKVIKGTNPSILEINYAEHLKWHEIRKKKGFE